MSYPPRPDRGAIRNVLAWLGRQHLIAWPWLLAMIATLLWLPYVLLQHYSRVQVSQIHSVEESDTLRVLTFNGPTTYYEGASGDTGFEYDLAQAFADYLGVKLELVVADQFQEILPRLRAGDADLAAAGIAIIPEREKDFRFTPPYQTVTQQVVYRRDSPRPRAIKDLVGHDLAVMAGTSFAEHLKALKPKHPELQWSEVDLGIEELLIEVWEGLREFTIADSNIIAVVRQFYPELHVGFTIHTGQQLAWAFDKRRDDSLFKVASDFLTEMDKNGDLKRLRDRYYGPASRVDFVNVSTFQRRIDFTLPLFQNMFEAAATEYDLDWRLLAAQAYQESLWDPGAVSPTGVRGMMMLTQDTADFVDVADRRDPAQSINGGARFLRQLTDRLPKSIEDPDRTWMGLAAYNVGMGHLEDARVLTQKQGGNPNKWSDVKERLPLLAKPEWYSKTEHGYARGYEPVQYVRNVRKYFDILVRHDGNELELPDELVVDAPAL